MSDVTKAAHLRALIEADWRRGHDAHELIERVRAQKGNAAARALATSLEPINGWESGMTDPSKEAIDFRRTLDALPDTDRRALVEAVYTCLEAAKMVPPDLLPSLLTSLTTTILHQCCTSVPPKVVARVIFERVDQNLNILAASTSKPANERLI